MSDPEFVLVLTTLPEHADATALARPLVDERLAACVSVLGPMTSLYRWQGNPNEDREQLLLIKTAAARVSELEPRLRALHPYDVPEFLVLPIAAGSQAYLGWVRDSTAG